ncbi:DUF2069 domain-containing protein [Pseudidiomarina homiensis]|uniref:DUF2069 domain-containing protein n=1 Tax=Pseudidiomarina homiensis TaxID=364198 RepID=A0A432Y3C8_9GAMM|nr:DUF2069 domain-containing protein [Pseudidiomarina homiensis]RUO55479.1 DUF2069 domain-containing protein [Pseudidiomarina homiensis]
MSPNISGYRWLALVSYIGLLSWVLIWQFATDFSQQSVLFKSLVYVLPLLFPLLGIIRGKPYTHAWANFILMWYFLHSLTMLYIAPEQRWWAAVELLLTTLAFAGCTLFARNQGRALGLGLKKLKDEQDG